MYEKAPASGHDLGHADRHLFLDRASARGLARKGRLLEGANPESAETGQGDTMKPGTRYRPRTFLVQGSIKNV